MRKLSLALIFLVCLAAVGFTDTLQISGSVSTVILNGVQIYPVSGPPVPTSCVYTYSNWGTCANGSQSRTVLTASPNGCTGTPILTQPCSSITCKVGEVVNPSLGICMISLNNRIGSTSFYGFNSAWAGQGIAFPANQTTNLYIDPSVVGLSSVGRMVIGDAAQRVSPKPMYLYRLKSDYSVNSSHAVVNFSCSTNQCAPEWPKNDPYKAGEKLLIKVTPIQSISNGLAYWAP